MYSSSSQPNEAIILMPDGSMVLGTQSRNIYPIINDSINVYVSLKLAIDML